MRPASRPGLHVALAAAMLWAGPAAAFEPEQVVLLGDAGPDWRQARQIVEAHGGRIVHILPPSVLVGQVPEGAILALRAASGADARGASPASGPRLVASRQEAESLLRAGSARGAGAADGLSAEAEAALRLLAPEPVPIGQDPTLRALPDGSVVRRPIHEWEDPPLERPARPRPAARDEMLGQAIGNTFYNTSDFMAGDVAVAILRPESTGVIDPSTEDWIAAEVTNSLTQILAALGKLANDAPRGRLTFVYRTESFGAGVAGTVACDYEAILYGNWNTNVVLNCLGKLGYSQAIPFDRLTEWVNDARADLGTDWAYGIVVVDNSVTGGGRASAFITGPAEWLFQNYTATVYHHETGHVFGALDEYHPDAGKSPTGFAGYTQEVNANSQCCTPAHVTEDPALAPLATGYFGGAGEGIPALMMSNIDYASPWARGAWGIWDLDGDGIYDPQDTFPALVLNAPTGTPALTFTGTATATPLKRETGSLANADITINRITGVEWRANGGPWQDAAASDGSFNASSEGFTFTTASLRNGPYVFEARARDNFGNATIVSPRREVTVSGSGVPNNVPMPALAVTPALGSTSTSFLLSAAGSSDAEDAANLQYRWDYENDGSFDTSFAANATAAHSYGTPGAKTAKVEVRDPAGATSTRTVGFTVSPANVPPTATFTADRGSAFGSSPAVFNFDGSGVSDGEDSTALEVRWDFEDDGVWDTGYSTTKTTSHDYAQGYAINVSFEPTAQVSLGCCQVPPNVITGFAQGFVPAGSGIGKASLRIGHYGDTTPGGTCEVGIRSALTGPFLTSVTKNQTSIVDFAFNVFDFPDIAVTVGQTYYLVMLCSDWDIMWQSRQSTAPDYPGGIHYYYLSLSGTWGSNANYDHVFRLYDSAPSAVPLTKSQSWRVRMEVKDVNAQMAQTVRDVWTNAYDTPPTVSLGSAPTSGTTATTFNLTATGADADSGTTWDGFLHYRWDVDGDGNFETEFGAINTRPATFAMPGTYQAAVEVRDRYHATARATIALTVAPPAGPSQIAVNAGDGQAGTVCTLVTVAPSAIVRDFSNNPVPGALVVFTVGSGAGSITGATQTTNGSGIATVGGWTLGYPGANSLTATVASMPGSLAAFAATAAPGGASDSDLDSIPDAVEATEATNPCAKDNDIFTFARLFAMQQYRDFLRREGESAGISYWISAIGGGMSRAVVVKSFFDSFEFQGAIAPVTRLYFAYFNRIPDLPGLQYWLAQYGAGMPLNDISQAFAGSPEFVGTYGSLDNSQFVTLVYNNVLGRAPDPGGFAYWMGQLDGGFMTRGQVMVGFSESPEYQLTSYNRVFVTMMYYGMLRRMPEQAGFDYWVAQLNAGALALDIINGFLGAPEYHGRFLP